MRFLNGVLGVSVVLGAGLLLGCSEDTGKPMKNQVPTKGAPTNVDMKLKGGRVKPMPEDPPPPQPPPEPGKAK